MLNTLKASNGSLDTSICDFHHHSLDDIWLSLDGDRWPKLPLSPVWTNPTGYLRAYNQLFARQGNYVDLGIQKQGEDEVIGSKEYQIWIPHKILHILDIL